MFRRTHPIVCLLLCVFLTPAVSAGDFSLCKKGKRAKTPEKRIDLYTHCIEEGGLSSEQLFDAYGLRGGDYMELGAFEKAIVDYKKSIEESLRVSHRLRYQRISYHNLGVSYYKSGQFELAVRAFGDTINFDPNYSPAFTMLGSAYRRLGKDEKAIVSFTNAISRNPKSRSALFNRGSLHRKLGQYDEAIEDFSEVLKLRRNDSFTFTARAIAYVKKGDYESALSDYDNAIKKDANNSRAYSLRGKLKVEYMDLKVEGLKDCTKAIELTPRSASAYFYRGTTLEKLGMTEQAIIDYKMAVDLIPDYEAAKAGLSRLGG